jgi:putative hydrolase of HD superfamily
MLRTYKCADAALSLKRVRRAGWVESGLRDVESVADHSFSLAIISMIASEMGGLDVARAVRMALIHDLAEAYTGDLTPGMKRRVDRKLLRRLEEAILWELFSDTTLRIRRNYLKLYRDYLRNGSAEARLVHMLDKWEMRLEAEWIRRERRRLPKRMMKMLEMLK